MRKEKLCLVFLSFLLIAVSFVSADATYYEENYTRVLDTDSSYVKLTKLRYESYPVSPGDYFTLYVQMQKTGSDKADAYFEFVEEYPFSLDSNENSIRAFSDLNNEPIVLEYKVRVDDSAVNGENVLKIRQSGSGASIVHEFDIYTEDVQTSFDAVVQENMDGEISIALANIGQNDAGAVIVEVLEQDGIRVTGTSGQMVGNLEQGDYTVVGFTLAGSNSILQMQIDYTDTIGVRRSEIVDMSFDGGLDDVLVRDSAGPANRLKQEADSSSSWEYWAVFVFVVIVLAFIIGNRYFGKQKNVREISSHIPSWMKKEKGAKK